MRSLVVLGFLALASAVAQSPSAAVPAADVGQTNGGQLTTAQINVVIHKQFGDQYMLRTAFTNAVLFGDFDGDGAQDAAFVADTIEPPKDADVKPELVQPNAAPAPQPAPGVKMIDPYDEYFGFGNAKVTAQFAQMDPRRPRFLLIIHGAGAEGWRAATPKARFIVVNLPFDKLALTRHSFKKREIDAFSAKETAMLSSLMFWTGKKYRWVPDSNLE